jgi:hypothetical protein
MADIDLLKLAELINAELSRKNEMTAGGLLIEAKKRCPRGQWLSWLKANVSCSAGTARAYMKRSQEGVRMELRPPLNYEGGVVVPRVMIGPDVKLKPRLVIGPDAELLPRRR